MIGPPRIWPFAVDHESVQLVWRHLRPGPLRITVATVGSVTPTGRYQGEEVLPGVHVADHVTRGADLEPWTVEPGGALQLAGGAHRGPGSLRIGGLPAGRVISIRVSGAAVGPDRLLGVRTLDALPGAELARFATLSDLHLGTEAFGQHGTIRERPRPSVPHPQRCTEAALAEVAAWGAQRVVVKGDLTNQGAAAHWREYARLVEATDLPVDAIPGNHDRARVLGALAVPPAAAAEAHGLSIADPVLVRDLPGVRIVLMDSTVAGRHGGSLDHADAVVDAVAEAPRSGGVVVALHHQLHPHRIPEGWPTGIDQATSLAFLERLGAAHPHVLVTSGHTHRHRRWGHAGVAVTQVGSTKDYPGVWGGYTVHEGGMRQTVWRVARPDCLAWTDQSRRAGAGLWRAVAPGRLDARCFNLTWSVRP